LISAWQLKVSPVRVRLRELLSILLAVEIFNARWHHLAQLSPSGGSLIAAVTARMSGAPGGLAAAAAVYAKY